MLTFKQFILEYLTDSQKKEYSDIKMNPEARSATDHYFGKDNDHVKEAIPGYSHDKSEVHKKIEQHLGQTIEPEHYKAGVIKDKYGRDAKIGRQIKDKKLLDQYNTDSTRAGNKNTAVHATIVRGTEVAGQTNSSPNAEHPKGHSWGDQSCKNVDTGSNRHYLDHEIKHGSVVYRAHDGNGQEIYRATLQPHLNSSGKRAYALNSEYGVKHPSFTAHANSVAARLSGEIDNKDPVHEIHPSVYNDLGNDTILHPKASSAHITKMLSSDSYEKKRIVLSHPGLTSAHITKALKDEYTSVRLTAMRHPNATAEHITKGLTDSNRHVAMQAIHHPNATVDHITKALNSDDANLRYAAIAHPKATPEHITKALKDEHTSVRLTAMRHPNATAEHITKGLTDKDASVRMTAIKHPNATSEHIDKALGDTNRDVRVGAIRHKNATPEHINRALRDPDNYVKAVAGITKKRNQE